jgi:type IX secretion system PorP/SprF family membrane protein
MKAIAKFYLIMLLMHATNLVSQDIHLTQFYSTPVYLNPAFTGGDVCSRVSLTYRNQWPGISKAYKSYLFSIDHYIPTQKVGIGLLMGTDVAGSGGLTTTLINPLIAYELKVTRALVMRFGVQPGIGIKSISYKNLLFGDQIVRGGGVPTIEPIANSRAYFDVGAGALAYTESFWIGTSFYHLNTPNEALKGEYESVLPIKYSVHGGYNFSLNNEDDDEKNNFIKKSLATAFNYRGQQKFDQLDIGVYYMQYIFNLGFWYRGIPFLKQYQPGYSNNDAIAVIVGLKTERLNIGYSYDYTISKLTNASHGAHEISLAYQLCKTNFNKKRRLRIPCPKF